MKKRILFSLYRITAKEYTDNFEEEREYICSFSSYNHATLAKFELEERNEDKPQYTFEISQEEFNDCKNFQDFKDEFFPENEEE